MADEEEDAPVSGGEGGRERWMGRSGLHPKRSRAALVCGGGAAGGPGLAPGRGGSGKGREGVGSPRRPGR